MTTALSCPGLSRECRRRVSIELVRDVGTCVDRLVGVLSLERSYIASGRSRMRKRRTADIANGIRPARAYT